MRRLFGNRRETAAQSPEFQRFRKKLADHLRDVARNTREEFGQPWGLIAMFLASGGKAEASVRIAGPKFALAKTQALRAVV
jgi:hypothetical protein